MDDSKQQSPNDAKTRPARENLAESGVDRTLIRWMSSLTPTERLEFVQRHVNAVEELRETDDST